MAQQEMSFILGDGERITSLFVRHGDVVDSIGFGITDKNGKNSTKYISNASTGDLSKIYFGRDEYVTRVTGTYALYYGANCISTITIYTNSNQSGYGPFGTGAGTQQIETFSTPHPFEGTIIGFFGSPDASSPSTPYVASIGVYAKYGPYGI